MAAEVCECGADMVRREGRHGPFFGCSTFPVCRRTRSIAAPARPVGFDRPYNPCPLSERAVRWLLRQGDTVAAHELAAREFDYDIDPPQWWED